MRWLLGFLLSLAAFGSAAADPQSGQGHGVLIRGQPCARRIAARFLGDPAHRPDDACFANLAQPIFEPPRRRP
jgi:hypothetical protein